MITRRTSASALLLAGLAACGGHSTAPAPAHSTVVAPAAAIAGTNRALAVAAAARALTAFPVPPGSQPATAAPVARLRAIGCFCGEVDKTLTRTGWWVVPLSPAGLVGWYDAHTPARTGGAFGPGAHTPAPAGEMDWAAAGRSTAYSTPELIVTYARLDRQRTAMRADVTLAARYDRTASTLVPSSVTSVDITRRAIDGPDTEPHTTTITDPTLLPGIVSGFDNLPSAYAGEEGGPCGSPVGIVYRYSVTLQWPDHTLAAKAGEPLCRVGTSLTLDGTHLDPMLEQSDAYDHLLQAALDAR